MAAEPRAHFDNGLFFDFLIRRPEDGGVAVDPGGHMLSERRSGSRYPIRVDVILDDTTRFRCGATLDLSHNGALVESEGPIPIGSSVRIVPLVDMRVAVFELRARVLRTIPSGEGTFLVALALDLTARERRAYVEIFESGSWSIGAPPAA
jgi:hypothetical protein